MNHNYFRLLIAMFFSICCFVGGIVYGDSPLECLIIFHYDISWISWVLLFDESQSWTIQMDDCF